MSKSKESFNRRERERAKKKKAEAKRERRLASKQEGTEETETVSSSEEVDEGEIIRQLTDLNSTFDAGDLDFEEFDQRRAELLARLTPE